jgi:leucyl aminopeptidase (aminopeptidase T)
MDYSALCRQIFDVSLRVRPREKVWINGWDHATELVSALHLGGLRRGCEVVSTVQSEEAWLHSIRTSSRKSLERLSPFQEALLSEADSYVFTLGLANPSIWAKVPEDRLGLVTKWFLERNAFVRRWMSTVERRGVKMLGLEVTLATKEAAKTFGRSYGRWRHLLIAGSLADSAKMKSGAKKITRLLGGSSEVRIRSPSGTNITFSLDDRPVTSSDGTISEEEARRGMVAFLPAGHVGTTVDEGSAEGTIHYDRAIPFQRGRTEGLTLQLKRGRIVSYEAASGVDNFEAHLRSLGGDSDRIAFFGVGLNPLLRLGYGQDDKVLGVVELNFGESRSRGGRNGGKGDWWGLVTRGSMTIGGRTVMERGRLMV